jgi:hypothetical protein
MEPAVADSPLTDSLSALSRFFVGDGTVEETLTRVADLTIEAVPPAELAGITMLVEGRQRTAIFTDETAPEPLLATGASLRRSGRGDRGALRLAGRHRARERPGLLGRP